MAHAERRDLYLRPTLITPDYAKEEPGEEAKRPRLTLRYLHELIDDIHVENGKLADQIDTLSNQLDELARKLDALDIWKEDNELAAGLEVRFAYVEPEDAAVAGDENVVDQSVALVVPEAQPSAASSAAAVPALQETGEGSEAFAREWSLVVLEDLSSSNSIIPHGAGELPASLQERMIENVKEAARIAEEIAAQASSHAEGGADHESASGTETAMSYEHAMSLPQPPNRLISEAPDSATEPLLAVGSNAEPSVPEASVPTAPAIVPPIRETIFRHEPLSSAHSYIPPRSERHTVPKKRSLWSRLFARQTL